jgi:hypothetical protein
MYNYINENKKKIMLTLDKILAPTVKETPDVSVETCLDQLKIDKSLIEQLDFDTKNKLNVANDTISKFNAKFTVPLADVAQPFQSLQESTTVEEVSDRLEYVTKFITGPIAKFENSENKINTFFEKNPKFAIQAQLDTKLKTDNCYEVNSFSEFLDKGVEIDNAAGLFDNFSKMRITISKNKANFTDDENETIKTVSEALKNPNTSYAEVIDLFHLLDDMVANLELRSAKLAEVESEMETSIVDANSNKSYLLNGSRVWREARPTTTDSLIEQQKIITALMADPVGSREYRSVLIPHSVDIATALEDARQSQEIAEKQSSKFSITDSLKSGTAKALSYLNAIRQNLSQRPAPSNTAENSKSAESKVVSESIKSKNLLLKERFASTIRTRLDGTMKSYTEADKKIINNILDSIEEIATDSNQTSSDLVELVDSNLKIAVRKAYNSGELNGVSAVNIISALDRAKLELTITSEGVS